MLQQLSRNDVRNEAMQNPSYAAKRITINDVNHRVKEVIHRNANAALRFRLKQMFNGNLNR